MISITFVFESSLPSRTAQWPCVPHVGEGVSFEDGRIWRVNAVVYNERRVTHTTGGSDGPARGYAEQRVTATVILGCAL